MHLPRQIVNPLPGDKWSVGGGKDTKFAAPSTFAQLRLGSGRSPAGWWSGASRGEITFHQDHPSSLAELVEGRRAGGQVPAEVWVAGCILMKGLKECMLPARWVFPLEKLSCRENYLDSRNATVVFALCKRYRWLKFYYQCHQPEKLSGGPTSPSDLSCGQPKTWNTYKRQMEESDGA